jgi:hypothetical protein
MSKTLPLCAAVAQRCRENAEGWAQSLIGRRRIRSLRALRFTPAFGRAFRVFDPVLYGTAEGVPFRSEAMGDGVAG